MATKILNLDEIETGVEKSFILNGKTHTMKPLSVMEFVAQTKRLDEMRASEASLSDSFEFMVDSICKAFPTVERDEVVRLDIGRIQKLTDYINADLEAEKEEGNVS
jgi:hypothetical protein